MVRLVTSNNQFKLISSGMRDIPHPKALTLGGMQDLYLSLANLVGQSTQSQRFFILFNNNFFLGGNHAQTLHDMVVDCEGLDGYYVRKDETELILRNKAGCLLFFGFENCLKSSFYVPPNEPDCFHLIEHLGLEVHHTVTVEELEDEEETVDVVEPVNEENVEKTEEKNVEETEERNEDRSVKEVSNEEASMANKEEPLVQDEEEAAKEQSEEQLEWQLEMMSPVNHVKAKPNLANKGPEVPLAVVEENVKETEQPSEQPEEAEETEEQSEEVKETEEVEEETSEEETAIVSVEEAEESLNLWKAAGLCPDMHMLQRLAGPKDASLMADLRRILREKAEQEAKVEATKQEAVDDLEDQLEETEEEENVKANELEKNNVEEEQLEEELLEEEAAVESSGLAYMRNVCRQRASRARSQGRGGASVRATVAVLEEKDDSDEDDPPPVFVGANGSQSY